MGRDVTRQFINEIMSFNSHNYFRSSGLAFIRSPFNISDLKITDPMSARMHNYVVGYSPMKVRTKKHGLVAEEETISCRPDFENWSNG